MNSRMLPFDVARVNWPGRGPGPEDDDRVDLRELLRMVWRRRWLIVACMVICGVLAGVAVKQVTPTYGALSKVMLDPRKRVVTNTEVVSDLALTETVVNSEASVLRSNVLIEAVIAELGFAPLEIMDPANDPPSGLSRITGALRGLLGAGGTAESGPTDDPLYQSLTPEQQKTERLVWAIRRSMEVWREGESYVIAIRAETEHPVLSAILANTLADQYILSQLDSRRDTAKRATFWIEQRVNELAAEVEATEDAVAEYRAASLLADGGSLGTASQQMAEINNQLVLARADRVASEARFEQLTALIDSGGMAAVAQVLTSPIVETLNRERLELTREESVWAARYPETHPERRRLAAEIGSIDADLRNEVAKILDQRRSEVEIARIREETMNASLKEMEARVLDMSRNAIGLRQLEREAEATRKTYEDLLSRLTETRTQERLQEPDAKLIERATVPGAPSAPRPKLMVAIGLMTGAALGLGLVLFLELTATTFRSGVEIERKTGVPVLTAIPANEWRTPRDAYREIATQPYGVYAERIRHLRTSVLMRDGVSDARSVLVMSSVPGEGKTTTALSLAQMSVMAEKSVILVDCDLRRSTLQQSFGWDMPLDFSDFIRNECDLDEAIYSDPALGFDVLAANGSHPMDADQLSATWLKPMLEALKQCYDVVIVDAPALLAVSDALVLAQAVDTRLYLVRWDSTPRSAVMKGLGSLDEMGLDLSGVVLTQVGAGTEEAYTDRYAYAS